VGLILDSSLLIADERKDFDLSGWLRARPPEPVAVSVVAFSELWFGIEVETDAARKRRRRRWIEKLFRRLEIIPVDARVARTHARIWAQLSASGLMVGPHDLIVAATALQRRWAVATFNAREFRHIHGLEVVEP
jgi:tRNA(fMet)-specific endonuclease VapC